MTRPVPQQAIEIIKKFEGFRAEPYLCPSGLLTIGYGTTGNVKTGMTVSQEEAEQMVRDTLTGLLPKVMNAVKRPLNNNQLSAILSFAYNVGIGNFYNSTLLKKINENDAPGIVREFKRWVYDNKKRELPGLIARRSAEAQLYFT